MDTLSETIADLRLALADCSLESPRSSYAVVVKEAVQAMEDFRHDLAVQNRSMALRGLNRALADFSLTAPFAGGAPLLEIKRSPSGTQIKGYASTFGVLDMQGEVVDPGAFAASLARYRRTGGQPKMFWQHDTHEIIGVWQNLVEDSKGLLAEGLLLPSVRRGQEAIDLIDAGAELGCSIGFLPVRDHLVGKTRHLQEVELLEISIVSFPSTPGTRIHLTSKEYGRRQVTKSLADIVRDLNNFSLSSF